MGMAEAKGREIWVYPGSVSRVLAGHIAVALEDVMPDEPWRGVKEGNLAVLRLTRMPACLVEVGFIDNSETVRKLAQASTQYEIAQAIAYGIDRYLIDGMGSLR
jgi:N-acetylmuramoyl-L-alanine amidase